MPFHNLLPFIAFLLNLSLAGMSLLRNAGARINRVFAYFVTALAVWNFGVFMLRRSPDAATAYGWEVFIHLGVVAVPALYYHFVLIYLDSTVRHRRSLLSVYAVVLVVGAINLGSSSLLLRGVNSTPWGWTPAFGPLYAPFLLFFYAIVVYAIVKLVGAYRAMESSFRRNRTLLVLLGSFVSLAGGGVDFLRFILVRFFPAVDSMYPVGIPANAVFCLLLGTSIVRYRMFDVDMVVRKTVVYGFLGGVITSLLVGVDRLLDYLEWGQDTVLWVVVPAGILMTALLSPLGHRVEDLMQRLLFSRRRGCYDTLLELSKRMSGILNFDVLVDTLVEGLVRGIPLTHCVLMVHEPEANSFAAYRVVTSHGSDARVTVLSADGPVVRWLQATGGVLVKEEAKLNPAIAAYFETREAELEEIAASLIVPLMIEQKLIGILLLGEKVSGDIFGSQELEVLSVLANQGAIALQNARLYQELGNSNAQLVQASRLKSQFLASMSHELRTPLNSIIGFSKVLLNRLDGDLSDRQETYVRSVHASSTHLLQLINSILDISRIEAGKLELNAEDIDLHELVDECVETSLALVRTKPLKLEQDVAPELPSLRADRTKVKQILLNLLSNAIKFTDSGRIVVRVVVEGEGLHLSVIDAGVGIREDDIKRLFEPFRRLDNPLARKADGTGLGLAISKKFVELHGGQMWVESRQGHGSTFHFTLPIAPAAVKGAAGA